jgi:hypothetical protein
VVENSFDLDLFNLTRIPFSYYMNLLCVISIIRELECKNWPNSSNINMGMV